MKTVTGRVISAEPISLSKAATILSGFVSSENEASQDVSAYLRRGSAAFTELKSFHREIKSTKPKSEARHERNPTDGFQELVRAKGIDDLVENGEKIRSRESESVTEEELIHGRKQDKNKKNKEGVVEEKLEDVQRNEERKERKKKRKKNKEDNVSDEKVDVKLEEEQLNEDKKNEKKKKKRKKNKEDVIDKKVNVKVEEEQRSEEKTERKKKRKSDGEIGSEEKKSKKKRKSKEIEG